MKTKKKITKNTLLADIASDSQLAEILIEEFGLFCVGCPMAQAESLQQGALTHGLTDEQVTQLVERLNASLSSRGTPLDKTPVTQLS